MANEYVTYYKRLFKPCWVWRSVWPVPTLSDLPVIPNIFIKDYYCIHLALLIETCFVPLTKCLHWVRETPCWSNIIQFNLNSLFSQNIQSKLHNIYIVCSMTSLQNGKSSGVAQGVTIWDAIITQYNLMRNYTFSLFYSLSAKISKNTFMQQLLLLQICTFLRKKIMV